jgi:hypothetical protein
MENNFINLLAPQLNTNIGKKLIKNLTTNFEKIVMDTITKKYSIDDLLLIEYI